MVRYFDAETRQVVSIPAAELAPGMIRARIEGIDEPVWVDPAQLQAGPVCHASLSPGQVAAVRAIQQALAEVYPRSLGEWEEGFKRDRHPDRELAVWLRIAGVFRRFAAEGHT